MELHFKLDEYAWGDRFFIYDKDGQKVYRVRSSAFLWNRKFEILDLDKNVLVTIKKEPKSLLNPKYYIFTGDDERAAITKELSPIPKFLFEGVEWQMRGVMRHEYEILQGSREVLSVHKESTGWGRHPVLKIDENTDALLALAVALTVSYVFAAREDGKNTDHR